MIYAVVATFIACYIGLRIYGVYSLVTDPDASF